ncbi:hypothetical protein AB0J72_40600 [Dactylosporangium sp. NPDC049742]|uniref:hypothetical protein n=1 Tax=Dactylosporangium sp. NPDC049742 TaxID=3154737 RepID=UPI00343517FF
MLAQDSPFRPFWWGVSRTPMSTYGRYEFAELPPVPFAMSGDLGWLAAQPAPDAWGIGSAPAKELPALLSACAALGLSLPPSFVKFAGDGELQRRIRSCTACFVDVSAAPVPAPAADGYLVRFLADQQGCLYWYLYVAADGSDHAVVCSPSHFGPSAYDDPDVPEDWDDPDGEPGPDEVVYCGESFEAFLCRYWLENELWFADNESFPLPAVDAAYIEDFRTFSAAEGSVTG